MGLLELLGVSKKKKVTVKFPSVPVEEADMEHLTSEGDLPWGWITANREFVERIEAEYQHFSDSFYASRSEGVLKEYAALKSLVLYMEDVKKLCAAKGECFAEWASDLVANQKILDQHKARLKYIEENIDTLLEEEKRKQYIETTVLPTLRSDLLAAIRTEPGILQSEIFKLFDADLKQYIQQELYSMDKDGVITREKSGRSYAVYLN